MVGVAEYIKRAHRGVEGWLRPEAAQLIAGLAESQDARGAVAEIGVHHGKLFILLALSRRADERAVAIDVFEDQDLNVDGSGLGNRAALTVNLRRFGVPADSVRVHKADSTTLTSKDLIELGGGRFRLFSVDGGHTAEITESDLAIASDALCDTGLIVLDDYFNVSWPGVSEGANRFMARGPEVVPFASGHGKMYFARPSAVEAYRETVTAIARRHDWKLTQQEFFGLAHTIVMTRPRPNDLRSLRRRLGATRAGRAVRARFRP